VLTTIRARIGGACKLHASHAAPLAGRCALGYRALPRAFAGFATHNDNNSRGGVNVQSPVQPDTHNEHTTESAPAEAAFELRFVDIDAALLAAGMHPAAKDLEGLTAAEIDEPELLAQFFPEAKR